MGLFPSCLHYCVISWGTIQFQPRLTAPFQTVQINISQAAWPARRAFYRRTKVSITWVKRVVQAIGGNDRPHSKAQTNRPQRSSGCGETAPYFKEDIVLECQLYCLAVSSTITEVKTEILTTRIFSVCSRAATNHYFCRLFIC